jgi:hypothetical protein
VSALDHIINELRPEGYSAQTTTPMRTDLEGKLTIFVHTTDTFEDCWEPFFTLLKHYWPTRRARVLLNTQFKDFKTSDPFIKSAKVGNPSRFNLKQSWSCRLLAGLKQVDTPYVLYLQEDYFLNAPVNVEMLLRCLGEIDKGCADYVGFHCSEPDADLTPADDALALVPQKANYRLCTQAGLWSKSTLLKYTIPGESVWEWERYGSRRAHKGDERFLCVQRHIPPVFPYIPTGVVRGRWYAPAVVDLFAEHRINVNFTKRGFYDPPYIFRKSQQLRSALRRIYMKI